MRANNYYHPAMRRRGYIGDAVPSVTVTPQVDMSSLNDINTGSTSGWSTQDWSNALNSIGQLATIGIKTYATVSQIEAGNSAPYAISTGTPAAGTIPVATPAAGFSLNSLFDFNTPFPYLLAAGAVYLVWKK